MCPRVVSDIQIADTYLCKFCVVFEGLYEEERVTPNMHFHGHLIECVKDFGSVYSFWLFSFERDNGILGNIPTNKRNIEIKIMNWFNRDNGVLKEN